MADTAVLLLYSLVHHIELLHFRVAKVEDKKNMWGWCACDIVGIIFEDCLQMILARLSIRILKSPKRCLPPSIYPSNICLFQSFILNLWTHNTMDHKRLLKAVNKFEYQSKGLEQRFRAWAKGKEKVPVKTLIKTIIETTNVKKRTTIKKVEDDFG